MKILSVRFKNINSLKDEHHIDFSQPPFFGSGLFSITGATGAGKTTILDAITLALYGRTPRQKPGEQVTEVVTRFTASAFSEVVFESAGIHYRARWSIRRARNKPDGAFQQAQMEVAYAKSGELIESKRTETIARITALINLDYDQFLRSVLLAQGDFTRFLKADDKEKSALLEKVTNTAIYSRISAFIYEKAERIEKRKLEDLHQKLADVNLLSDQDLLTQQQLLEELTTQEVNRTNDRNRRIQEKQWLERVDALRTGVSRWTEEHTRFQSELQAQEPQLNLLRRHRKALPAQAKITELMLNKQQWTRCRTEISMLQTAIPQQEQQCAAMQQQKEEATKRLQQIQKEQIALEGIITQILPLDERIGHATAEYERLHQQQVTQQDAHQREANRLSDLQIQFTQHIVLLSQANKWLEDHQSDAQINTFLPEYKTLVAQLREIGERQARNETARSEGEQKLANAQAGLKDIMQQLTERRADKEAKEKELKDAQRKRDEWLQGNDLKALRTQSDAQQEQSFLCDKQFELAQRVANERAQVQEMSGDLAENEKLAEQAKHEGAMLTQQLSTAIELMDAYQEIAHRDRLIADYESARKQLSSGQPCPLCGSTTHPHVTQHPDLHFNEHVEKQRLQKEEVERLRKQVANIEIDVARLVAANESLTKTKAASQRKIDEDIQRFNDVNRRLPAPLNIDDTSLIQRLAAKKQQEASALQDTIAVVAQIEEVIRTIQEALQAHQLFEKEWSGKNETYMTIMNTSVAQIRHAEREIEACQTQVTALETALEGRLLALCMKYNPATHEITEADLQQRRDRFAAKQEEQSNLQRNVELLEQDISHAVNACTVLEEDLSRTTLECARRSYMLAQLRQDRIDLFGEKAPEVEQRRMREQLTAAGDNLERFRGQLEQATGALAQAMKERSALADRVAGLEDEAASLTAELAKLATHTGFSSVAELSSAVLTAELAGELEAIEQTLNRRAAEISQSLTQTQAELTKEIARQLTPLSVEDLELQIEQADVTLRELNQQMGSVRTLLAQNREATKRFHEIQAAAVAQEQVYRRWRRLSEMIGSADGDKFKRFAQGVTLARLVQLANVRLAAFSTRYQLIKQPGNGLELEISDIWQAGAVRPVSTLSGGESFLVSLALALGLSDLASSRIQIDSLFIDEGFGTLDSETLEVAIDALENLRADGKLIGIISHVDALKERIGAQIHVKKLSGGHSAVQLMAFGAVVTAQEPV